MNFPVEKFSCEGNGNESGATASVLQIESHDCKQMKMSRWLCLNFLWGAQFFFTFFFALST